MMKEMKRILSLVLCLVMVLGMMPMVALNASAAEGTDGDDVAAQDAPTLLAEGEVNETVRSEGEIPTTVEKQAYVLSSSMAPGNTYVIASSNVAGSAVVLSHDGDSVTESDVTIKSQTKGNQIITYIDYDEINNDSLWMFGDDNSDKSIKSGGYYLSFTTSGKGSSKRSYLALSAEDYKNWTYDTSNHRLSVSAPNGKNNANHYLRYNNAWEISTTKSSVYCYLLDLVEASATKPVQGVYSLEAEDVVAYVSAGATAALTGTLVFTPDEGPVQTWTEVGEDPDYSFDVTNDPNGIIEKIEDNVVTFTGKAGTARVKISCEVEPGQFATYHFNVEAKIPTYSLDLHKQITGSNGNPAAGELIGANEIIPVKEIEDGKTYSVWAVIKEYRGTEEGVDLGDVEDGLITWETSDPDIATVDKTTGLITFHGKEGLVHITATYTGGLNADKNYPTDTVTFSATTTEYMVPSDGTNDFPIYHEPGAIRFDKTAEPVGNFSQTGVAQLELSMTGIPYGSAQGLDVVLMLDMSNSMTDTRIKATRAAVKVFVENIVLDEEGNFTGNRLYIGSFAGGNPEYAGQSRHDFKVYKISEFDDPYGDYGYQIIDSHDELDALIGTKKADGTRNENGAIDTVFKKYSSHPYGTEYDQSLEVCYNLLKDSRKTGNKQFCVFMSDGIPNVYRYGAGEDDRTISSESMAALFANEGNTKYATRGTNYKYEYWSSLMKQEGVTVFSVGLGLNGTNSSLSGASAAECERVANMLLNDISGPAGETAEQRDTGKNVSKLDKYFFSVKDANAAADMKNVFENIADKIKEAATDITVTDKITDEYTMIFGIPQSVGNDTAAADRNEAVANALANQDLYIEVINYNLNSNYERDGFDTLLRLYLKDSNSTEPGGTYSAATDANGTAADTLTFVAKGDSKMAYWSQVASDYKAGENDIVINVNGQKWKFMAKGNGTHNVASGAYAYGTIDATTNMSNDLVIITPYFAYSAATRTLAWTVDKLEEFKEIALRYFLYLEESAADVATENETAAGPYPTNEWAYMTYTNHLGHLCRQEFPKPQMNWNGAQASYVFYLVNAQGQPVNKYGQVVDFVNATFVTDVFTEAVVWNRDGSEGVGELNPTYLASEKLPENYTLYDPDAKYVVHVYEDESGLSQNNYFTISGAEAGKIASHLNEELPNVGATADNVSVTTTKVYNTIAGEKISGYGTYTPASDGMDNFNFSNTTVAFAVVWQVELVPDAVVVDYGLDVLINVVQNDFLQNTVSGLGKQDANLNGMKANVDHYNDPLFASTMLEINGHTIKTEEGKENLIRFQQGNMTFDKAITFYYESPVKFYQDSGFTTQYMYSTVTVIPATTIYYEDSFLEFSSYDKSTGSWVKDTTSEWVQAPQTGTQAQDRPGASKISAALDADNNYGYDAAYQNMSTHSLGAAAKLTVDANTYGEVKFTFWGTGFDLISLTSGATGTMTVLVQNEAGKTEKNIIVDTYYGMDAEGNVSANSPDIIYQVPVAEVAGLTYGKYTVTITAAWADFFDHVEESTSYDLYVDAVRIYDPTGNNDPTSMDAYFKDNEAYPVYTELRDKIIAASNYQVTKNEDGSLTVTGNGSDDALKGGIFIDCSNGTTAIADYVSYGPNNELYLANNQAIAFNVNLPVNVADVQLGIKVANGESVTYEINGESCTVSTATDMYYSILKYAESGLITIKNVSGGILSLTNIKVTHKSAPEQQTADELLSVTPDTVRTALLSLRRMPVVEEEIPETTEPEIPETTVPEETEPTVPEKPTHPTPEKPNPGKPNPGKPNPGKPGPGKPEETDPEFEPTVKVKIKKTTVNEGKKVDVEIRTSDDVALITVNGMTVTKYKTDKKTGERTWTCSLKAEKAGDMEIEVIAYSADGDAAEPVSETVKVVGKPAKKGKGKK